MSRKANQSNVWDFTVASEPLFTADGTNTGYFANRRTDNKAFVGCTSEHYGIIQNGELINAIEEMFNNRASEIGGFKRNIVTTKGGSRMFAIYDFDTKEDTVVGDIVGMRILARNSFDRSWTGSLIAGANRKVCSNGMTSMEREVGVTAKHSTNISTKFLSGAIDNVIAAFNRTIEGYRLLATVKIKEEEGENIIKNMAAAKKISERMSESFLGSWQRRSERYSGADENPTFWNLYNAVTEKLKSVESVELSYRTSDYVLRALSKAAKKPEVFARLTRPVKQELVVANN